MNHFILLVYLCFICTVQQALSADFEPDRKVRTEYVTEKDKNFELWVKKPMRSATCAGISNKNQKFKFDEPPNYVTIAEGLDCELQIQRRKSNEGKWTVIATGINQNGENYTEVDAVNLKIKDTITSMPIAPINDITVSTGDFVKVYIPGIDENFTSCTLLDEKNIEYDLTSNESENFELFKECGVSMKVNNTHSGKWKLYARFSNNTVGFAEFKVNVKKVPEQQLDATVHAKRSQTHKIEFGDSITHCYISDPHGNEVIERQGKCFYDIPVVTSYHDGSWVARYFVSTENVEREAKILLQTYDKRSVNAKVTFMRDGSINLLCEFKHTIKLCLFERPDKQLLPVHAGIGNDKYEYHGQGFGPNYSEEYQECGITIRQPNKTSDFGTWKCITDPFSENHSGSILHVEEMSDSKTNPKVAAVEKVYVVRGESFQIKCSAETVLDYCWMQSPNGTKYSVSREKKIPKGSLPYHGAGLALGECGATIEVSNQSSDGGMWSCHMGIQNGSDLKAHITVIVTETPLMAEEDAISLGSEPVTMTCVPVPDSEFDINYCRWIKPDGTGIHYQADDRYKLETNSKYCKLSITGNNCENDGRWTCVAGVNYKSSTEYHAYIDVHSRREYTYSVYLLSTGICVVLVLSFLIGWLVVHKKLSKRGVLEIATEKKNLPTDIKYLM